MHGLFAGLLKAGRALVPRPGVQQRANYIRGKPPKDKIGAESVFVLMVMTLAILGPSGWILAHLDRYRTRD
uniref:Cytochrome c oxidase subunit 8A, mitochondrial n=1 Tax=Amphilophus citrinellus TaxID=61819 RepID=A0A3Q0SN95_AMPCI